jgi:hypothetical protein
MSVADRLLDRVLAPARGLPRMAVAVVAGGLFLSVLSPLLYDDATYGGELEWVQSKSIPNSAPVRFGDGGGVRIQAGAISSTEPNFSGYWLYRISGTLAIRQPRSDPVSDATCTLETPDDAIVGRTANRRAAYPRPSENLAGQPVPHSIVVQFAAEGGETVGVRLSDVFGRYVIGSRTALEWAPFEEDHQTYLWAFEQPQPGTTLKLRFASLWRTTGRRQASIACNIGDGVARARTSSGGF